MKSSTRLDSVVFHLTPTRTRCDLVLLANGKSEKIASGLLNPFLAHLKTAQDQMEKGGYSIILQPESGHDAPWFTKETVKRFVRFVSTPEVLERVYTIESEMLQIQEAIAIQGNGDIGLSAVEDHQSKPVESIEVSQGLPDSYEEKAIVLYKPDVITPEAKVSSAQESNSKVQLLRVLETRKNMLQKEQGMAFARAVAAGFDIDHMAPLISFSENFGASRLLDACVRFTSLWKKKHETGQWLELEAADVREAWPEVPETNGTANIETGAGEKSTTDNQSGGTQDFFPGKFPHPMYPSWPIHSPPGAVPIFQAYPMPGIPYYQNYPNTPFFQPHPQQALEDHTHNTEQRMKQKRHSIDSKEMEYENGEMEKDKSQEETEMRIEGSQSRERRKTSSRPGRKQSGTVVIRNINYITSEKHNSSNSDSESASSSETYEEEEELQTSSNIHDKKSHRSSKGKKSLTKSMDSLKKEKLTETESGHWQAFQSFLLKDADEEEKRIERGMSMEEKDFRVRGPTGTLKDDSIVYDGRDMNQYQEENIMGMQNITGSMTRMLKESNDGALISRRVDQRADGRIFIGGQLDVQSTEMDARRIAYRRSGDDGLVYLKQENWSGVTNSSDPLAMNGFETRGGVDNRSSHNIDDDSYIISLRSGSLGADGRNAIDMDSELPSSQKKAVNISNRAGGQGQYEPNDLNLMPERRTERSSMGYDVALDYEMQAHNGTSASNGKGVDTHIKKGFQKAGKDPKSKLSSDTLEKKKILGPVRKGRPSKLSPLDEARARAEKLRTFKADLQKIKKEKEEEDLKRLEALKVARQKRIAARGSSVTAQSSLSLQNTRKQLPTKHSPSSQKGSKFSDSEPGTSSPLQVFPIRATSLRSNATQNPTKPGKMNNVIHSAGSKLSQSVPSLPKKHINVMPDTKASMSRIRRLSEPKISSSERVSTVKARSAEPSTKPSVSTWKARNTEPSRKLKLSDGSESKKIYAIVNHDKSKAASLPELRIRTPKRAYPHEISAAKELLEEKTGSKTSNTETEMKRNKDKMSHPNDVDDSTVIEKKVVMLECEKPYTSAIQASNENIRLEKVDYDNHNIIENPEVVSDYANIHAPVSQAATVAFEKESVEHQMQMQANACEIGLVTTANIKDNVSDIPYQAPYARVSSLEDPSTRNSEYGRAPPANTFFDTKAETVKAPVSDLKSLKLEKIPETSDKPQSKEPSKGIRRLLKFGRKTHGSANGEHTAEPDSEAAELVAKIATSTEVDTLKNLISQDETPTASTTTQKSSRHFSLLSPFKSKSSEKKLTTT